MNQAWNYRFWVMNFLVFFLLFSCTSHKESISLYSPYNEESIDMELQVDEKSNLWIVVENKLDDTISISNPKYFVNSELRLSVNNINLNRLLRIKPNYSNREKFINIDPSRTQRFLYSYNLEQLYDLTNHDTIRISYIYSGIIRTDKGELPVNPIKRSIELTF